MNKGKEIKKNTYSNGQEQKNIIKTHDFWYPYLTIGFCSILPILFLMMSGKNF